MPAPSAPLPAPPHLAVPEPTISLHIAGEGRTVWLKVDEYVAGVVGGEIENSWPLEAIKAQSILARTFVMEKLESGTRSRYGTDASTDVSDFQAYQPSAINGSIRAAVASTRGKALTYNGQLIQAFFHSCSGGRTATALEGLNFKRAPTPYLRPVTDGPCSAEKEETWTRSFSAGEVGGAAGTGPCTGISITGRGPSGRAVTFLINGREVNAVDLRTRLGPNRMKSTLITGLDLRGGRVYMSGRGWGHGVGMSQWGAHDRAQAGQTAEQIVSYYYLGTRIEQLWK